MYKKLGYLLLLILLTGNQTMAQASGEQAVASAVTHLTGAMIAADKADLEKYTSDKLSYGHSSGVVQNKKEFVEAITSGQSDFVTIDITDQNISLSGNTAIVRHILSATTNDSGKPGTVKLSILLVWQKLHGQWKLLARQAVKAI